MPKIDTSQKFTFDEIENWKNEIKEGFVDFVPYFSIQHSTLGGKERASILFTISLDSPEDWTNKIFENSRHTRFHLEMNGELEQFQKHYKIEKKFRKARVKTASDVVNKVKKYLEQIL